MQGYYQQPPQMGMGGGGMGGVGGGMGMGMGMDPRMQMQQQQMMNGGMGGGGMGIQGAMNPMMGGMGGGLGQMWRNLGYDYQLPTSGYKPETTWGAWDLANAQYSGSTMDRSTFDNILNSLGNFFSTRHLTEDAARDAHKRVYHLNEGHESGSKTLGGAAAYQAFLIWDRDHHSAFHSFPTTENRERLAGLAYAEVLRLWESVQPRSHRAKSEDALEYATATAQHLFDRHYDSGNHQYGHSGRRTGWFGGDDDSDAESERRHRRRSVYGNNMGMGQMMPGQGMMQSGPGMYPNHQMMGGGMMNPMMGGQGMGGGMMPGQLGQMGQMGQMGPMGMGMGGMNGMGGMGMGGMGYPQQGMMGQGNLAMGMIPMGGNGMGIPESQAAPGMHPYTYGTQSGVAWGNQAIDQMGNPTYPGGRYGGGGGWVSTGWIWVWAAQVLLKGGIVEYIVN